MGLDPVVAICAGGIGGAVVLLLTAWACLLLWKRHTNSKDAAKQSIGRAKAIDIPREEDEIGLVPQAPRGS